jgi:hypothetical protein
MNNSVRASLPPFSDVHHMGSTQVCKGEDHPDALARGTSYLTDAFMTGVL